MRVDPPHDIVPGSSIPTKDRGRFLPLSPLEADRLSHATAAERKAFIESLDDDEKVARWLEGCEAPAWMVYRARRGDYANPRELDRDARKAGRVDLIAALRDAGAPDTKR